MDRGWNIAEMELFSETVTTADNGYGEYAANLAYIQPITTDTAIVTFDGAEYICPSIHTRGGRFYGGFDPDSDSGPDFSKYPFFISSFDSNSLVTETAGEHTVAVSSSDMQTSADFDKARGYGYKDAVLFNETVTAASANAVMQLAYSGIIDADTIMITFDDTEYECTNQNTLSGRGAYGAMRLYPSGYDFSNFPFLIDSNDGVNTITVEMAGEHTVSVTVTSMQTTFNFSTAVNAVSTIDVTMVPLRCVSGETTLSDMDTAFYSSQRLLYFNYDSRVCCMITSIYNDSSGWHITFIPDDSSFTAGFDENEVFTLMPAS